MVAVGPFVLVVLQADLAFEHDLGLGRDLERDGLAVDQLDLAAAQQAGEVILRKRVGHRRDRRDDGARVGADHRRGRQRLALSPVSSGRGAGRRRGA